MTEFEDRPSVGSLEFRVAMSRLAAGVSIVTAMDDEGTPRGLTATAVCSVSLHPPLVLASLSQTSTTHAAIETTGAFALHFLGLGEEQLARRFAGPADAKFEGLDWETGTTGCPVIPEALAVCECTLEQAVPAGDHTLFVGRVIRVSVNPEAANDPLIHFAGSYGALSRGGTE
ncbi:MAG: flavin reductase family protein [Gemmatimonadales bacterium]|jgi:flavin reductase